MSRALIKPIVNKHLLYLTTTPSPANYLVTASIQTKSNVTRGVWPMSSSLARNLATLNQSITPPTTTKSTVNEPSNLHHIIHFNTKHQPQCHHKFKQQKIYLSQNVEPTNSSLNKHLNSTNSNSNSGVNYEEVEKHQKMEHEQHGKATLEQLTQLEHAFTSTPELLFEYPSVDVFSLNILFLDNTTQSKTIGLDQYRARLALQGYINNLRFANFRYEMLSLIKMPEESCIKIRWRMLYTYGMFRNIVSGFVIKEPSKEKWKDVISTLHVNGVGKIYCHVRDNMDVDVHTQGRDKHSLKARLIKQVLNVDVK